MLKPSKSSQLDLARLLVDAGLSLEALRQLLPPEVSLPEGVTGTAEERMLTCIGYLADSGNLTDEVLSVIEEKRPKRQEELDRIRVDMDLKEPPHPLLPKAELDKLKEWALEGQLHEGERHSKLEAKLAANFKRFASTSIRSEEQTKAWLDAANRQAPETHGIWMIQLLGFAADLATPPAQESLRAAHNHLSAAGDPPWLVTHPPSTTPVFENSTSAVTNPGSTQPSLPPGASQVTPSHEDGYALVVGISEYKHVEGLRAAAKDARDFSTLLQEQQHIRWNVNCLPDEQATLRQILQGLDDLRRDCRRSRARNPPVIVYFSGHGMRDIDGRHYLVPYDGSRDSLFATALWNRTFSSALDELQPYTSRLVVFLDACHAEALAPEGTKGLGPLVYNPRTGLESPEGRYVVASCGVGQLSHEDEKNGVFTRHLVEILRCEIQDFQADGVNFGDLEEIDLWDLYLGLKHRVQETARERHDGALQVPDATLSGRTGIILAINRRIRDTRIQKERSLYAPLRDAVQASGSNQKITISTVLKEYVYEGRQESRLGDFYAIFREGAAIWRPGDQDQIASVCGRLIRAYLEAVASPERTTAVAPTRSMAANLAPTGGDEYARGLPGPKTSSARIGMARSPLGLPGQPTERRRLASSHREAILELIRSTPMFIPEARDLEQLLEATGGVSMSDFTDYLRRRPVRPTVKDEWDALLWDLGELFKKAWAEAEVVKPQNAFSVRMGKPDA